MKRSETRSRTSTTANAACWRRSGAKMVASLAYLMLGQTESVGVALSGYRPTVSASAQLGGFIDPYTKAQLSEELIKAVWEQPKGYITDPIKLASPSGLLILKVEEHYEAGQASFEEVREEVQNAVVTPRMEPKVREYLTRLRQEAFLQIKDGYVDSGAAPGKDTRWQEVAQLKPALTTKEEVLSRAKGHKKVLGVSIPGTKGAVKTLEETERAPKASKHRARPVDVAPEALESTPGPKAPKQQDSGPPMPPIKQ